jgi:hypothetical protein
MDRFKIWVEASDVFGFDDIKVRMREKEEEEKEQEEEDKPVKPFSVQWFMDSLARKKIGGRIRSNHAFLDQIIWGDKKDGSIRVRLQPNIVVYVERLITDLKGEPTWICKKVFKPDVKKFTGHEDIVAEDVFDVVEELWADDLDKTNAEYKSTLQLVKRMSGRMQQNAPDMYLFQDVKEVNPNYYIIYFSLRGAGVGHLAGRGGQVGRTPEATIDINYNKERGLIQIIMTTVTSGGRGNDDWQLDIPYLNAYYTPSQSKDEIIDTIITALKYF